MNEQQYIIFIRKKYEQKFTDKTSQVVEYKELIGTNYIRIKFPPGPKVKEFYDYPRERIKIYTSPIRVDLTRQAVYCKNMPFYEVDEILIFKDWVKVFKGSQIVVYPKKDIKIIDNNLNNPQSHEILDYWKEIAGHLKISEEEGESFLKKELDKMAYISEESVLSRYMHQTRLIPRAAISGPLLFPFRFNLSQGQAVENSFHKNISVIEGPPGTGKTQTILNLIANNIIRGKSIAIVSGNNSAVDNVKEKMIDHGYGFLLASLGKNAIRKKFFENLPSQREAWDVDISRQEKLQVELARVDKKLDRAFRVNNRMAVVDQEIAAYSLEQSYFERFYDQQQYKEMTKLPFYQKSPQQIIGFLADNVVFAKNTRFQRFIYSIRFFFKYGMTGFKSFFDDEMRVIIEFQKQYYTLKLEHLEREKKRLFRFLEKHHFQELQVSHQKLSRELFDIDLYRKFSNLDSEDFTLTNYKPMFKEFIQHFPVILSTTFSLRNSIPENYLLDTLIVDESSQVDLLSGILALSCAKNVVIVGDTRQLPQIIENDVKKQAKRYGDMGAYDYVDHNILNSVLEIYKDSSLPRVILKEHYRCHPDIIGFCNQKYYNGQLIPFTQHIDNENALMLYKTVEGNHTRRSTKGKINLREIHVIKEEVLKHTNLYTQDKSHIGITAPYRYQVDTVGEELELEYEADTIHKYQGREKQVMIMTTVLDNSRDGKIGMRFVDDPCKINVAVSRAEHQFILVTHPTAMTKNSREISDLIRYIEYNTPEENIIDSDIISVFDLLYKDFSAKLRPLQARLSNRSRYLSENIMDTLLSEILHREEYSSLDYNMQIRLTELFKPNDRLSDREKQFLNRSSVDFVITYKMNNQVILGIEVDGYPFHASNPVQQERDKVKESIFQKYHLDLARFSTNDDREEEELKKIFKNKLEQLLDKVVKL